jgi:outer membrane lipoprotein-sorting protein
LESPPRRCDFTRNCSARCGREDIAECAFALSEPTQHSQGRVLASGGTVVIYDPKTNEPPESYPLARTPLSIILAKNVNLSRAKMVVGHTADDKSTTVKAQDPEHPEYGNIELVFTSNPIELRQWVINDDAGIRTTVILGELDKKARMNNTLFNPEFALPQGSDR